MEARVGFEPVSPIDATQLIHSTTRQKRQNGQISRIEVHGGYAANHIPFLSISRLAFAYRLNDFDARLVCLVLDSSLHFGQDLLLSPRLRQFVES